MRPRVGWIFVKVIQYKFSASEFDVNKLDQMSNDNNGVITEKILRECVING